MRTTDPIERLRAQRPPVPRRANRPMPRFGPGLPPTHPAALAPVPARTNRPLVALLAAVVVIAALVAIPFFVSSGDQPGGAAPESSSDTAMTTPEATPEPSASATATGEPSDAPVTAAPSAPSDPGTPGATGSAADQLMALAQTAAAHPIPGTGDVRYVKAYIFVSSFSMNYDVYQPGPAFTDETWVAPDGSGQQQSEGHPATEFSASDRGPDPLICSAKLTASSLIAELDKALVPLPVESADNVMAAMASCAIRAPVSPAAMSVMLEVIAADPDVQAGGEQTDGAGRVGLAFYVDRPESSGATWRHQILIDAQTGTLLEASDMVIDDPLQLAEVPYPASIFRVEAAAMVPSVGDRP